jgi:O-acetylhomoserine/O-acetylserine sulfhydrylase-like pyridoxal-dependent enzyme
MVKIIKKWVAAVAGFSSIAVVSRVLAQVPTLVNPLNTSDANVVLQNITVFLIAIAAPICGIMVVWGGFQMMTSRGNPEKFSEGKKTLLYAAVGFVIVLCAGGAAQVIQSIFNGS